MTGSSRHRLAILRLGPTGGGMSRASSSARSMTAVAFSVSSYCAELATARRARPRPRPIPPAARRQSASTDSPRARSDSSTRPLVVTRDAIEHLDDRTDFDVEPGLLEHLAGDAGLERLADLDARRPAGSTARPAARSARFDQHARGPSSHDARAPTPTIRDDRDTTRLSTSLTRPSP